MLDVHPPHHPTHTWRDFFIHIATICVGLLIAVGLEQTVEALHRNHEAAELRETLKAESAQILRDSQRTEIAQVYQLQWLDERLKQVKAAVWKGHKLEPATPEKRTYFASPDIPLWRAAKQSAQTTLLTKGEVNGYSEVEYVQTRVQELDMERSKAESDLRRFNGGFLALSNGQPDFGQASPQQMQTYLALLTAELDSVHAYLNWIRLLIGAESAVCAGKTSLEDIYRAERDAAQVKDSEDPNVF
jgi:hypothetical protein